MTIGERIKNRREELGLTQDELAHKCGYKSRSSINKIELSRDLPLRKVSLMAEALQTTPGYLMGWEDRNGNITRPITTDEFEGIGNEDLKTLYNEVLNMYNYNLRRTHNGFYLETSCDEYGDYHRRVLISDEELETMNNQISNFIYFTVSNLYNTKEHEQSD